MNNHFLVYAKGYAASIGGVLTLVVIGLPALGIAVPIWLAIVTLVVTSIAVIAIPNEITEQKKAEIVNEAVMDPTSPVTMTLPRVNVL
jgi:hypothetical protein